MTTLDQSFARDVATLMRDAAVRMVNTTIVLHENAGHKVVTLDMLRTVADGINGLALPGDKPKESR